MKAKFFFLVLVFMGFIQFMNAQENNYCEINNISRTVFTPYFHCKYCDWHKDFDLNIPFLIKKYDLNKYDICQILNHSNNTVSYQKKCVFNSLMIYLTVTHFFVYYAGNLYTHNVCYGKNNPSNTHVVDVEYINQTEEYKNIPEADVLDLINTLKEFDGKIDHESYLDGMRKSTEWALQILKKSCN